MSGGCDYLMWEERCKMERILFPALPDCADAEFEIRRVYPLKQRDAYRIAKAIENDVRVAHVCLIGSSVSMKCTRYSDIDLIIQMAKDHTSVKERDDVSLLLQELTNWNCDIIWYDHLDETDSIYKEIERGVFLK